MTLTLPVAERAPGNHPEQVIEQDEEKDGPEKRQEAIGAVAADCRSSHLISDEQEHCLEHIHEPAAAERRSRDMASNRHHNHDDQAPPRSAPSP